MRFQTVALHQALVSLLDILFSGAIEAVESSTHLEGARIRKLLAVLE